MTKSERGMVANIYYNINHTPASWRLRRLVADDFEDALARDCCPAVLAAWFEATNEDDEDV